MPFEEGNEAGKQFWFKKGQSGNPAGRPKKPHLIREIERAIARKIEIEVEGPNGVMKRKKVPFAQYIAEVAMEKAAEGEFQFIKLIMEHLHGRPIQRTEIVVSSAEEQANEINDFLEKIKRVNSGESTDAVVPTPDTQGSSGVSE